MAKKHSAATDGQTEAAASGDVSFEDATAELGRIVTRLESGQESLEQSLASFERGMALLRTCHQKLDAAAQKIEIVTRQTADGLVLTESFSAEATHPTPATSTARSRRPAAKAESSPETDGDDSRGLF
jgi:exodeoxyribonuclease VII small subunit